MQSGSARRQTALEKLAGRAKNAVNQGTQDPFFLRSSNNGSNRGKDSHHERGYCCSPTGRRSGKQRTVLPAFILMDGRNFVGVLVAFSPKGGRGLRHPTGWMNFKTTSEAWIQIKGYIRRREVMAEHAFAAEKQRLWPH